MPLAGAATVGQRLLGTLPERIRAPREHVPGALIDYLAEQIGSDEPGRPAPRSRSAPRSSGSTR